MLPRFTMSTLLRIAHGWRLTHYDASNQPVASFWAPLKQDVLSQAARVMGASQ